MKKLTATERANLESWLRGVAKTANDYGDRLDPKRSAVRSDLVKKLDAIARVAGEAASYAELGYVK